VDAFLELPLKLASAPRREVFAEPGNPNINDFMANMFTYPDRSHFQLARSGVAGCFLDELYAGSCRAGKESRRSAPRRGRAEYSW
jgi:hypothetical protein